MFQKRSEVYCKYSKTILGTYAIEPVTILKSYAWCKIRGDRKF